MSRVPLKASSSAPPNWNSTLDRSFCSHDSFDLSVSQAAVLMTATEDTKWAVVAPRVIEMYSYRHHALQDLSWRLNMLHAFPHRPIPEARCFLSGLNFDSEVLMERHFPIRFSRLVEKDSAYRKAALAK